MVDQFSHNPEPESNPSDPTLPHMPRVPDPEGEHLAPTRPGSLPVVPGEPYESTIPSVSPSNWGSSFDEIYDMPSEPLRPARERARQRRVKRRGGGEWAWVVIALALFGVTLVVSMSVFMVLRSGQPTAVANHDGMVAAAATAVVAVPTAVPGNDVLNPGGGPGFEPQANDEGVVIEPWNGEERFTILLMGWDRRPGDTDVNGFRTDTMMLVSMDPATGNIGVLSIPRDLYVNIPGYSQLQRVNSAFVLGELQQPGYGPQLTMQTVQYNLGIRVHDYLIVDFRAFITIVDVIGGIDVDVPYTISDPLYPDMYFGYDPFYIEKGMQHLNGATALKYARTRHSTNDFRRAERQQQVLFAIRDRILNLGTLPQLIISAPGIWANLQDSIRTGLTLDQILKLAWYAKDISLSNMHTGVIDERYTSFYNTPSGSAVLIPDRRAIGPLMVEIFGEDYAR